MDDREKVHETLLSKKEYFYGNLNVEDTTNADYLHEKRVCKDFKIKKLAEYYILYVQSITLLLA